MCVAECTVAYFLAVVHCTEKNGKAKEAQEIASARSFQHRSRRHCGAFCIVAGTSSLGHSIGGKKKR